MSITDKKFDIIISDITQDKPININDIELIKTKIDNLEKKLDNILKILESDCKKMSNHIDFIENVYDNVKTPFTFLMNSVNNVIKIPFIKDVKPSIIRDVEISANACLIKNIQNT